MSISHAIAPGKVAIGLERDGRNYTLTLTDSQTLTASVTGGTGWLDVGGPEVLTEHDCGCWTDLSLDVRNDLAQRLRDLDAIRCTGDLRRNDCETAAILAYSSVGASSNETKRVAKCDGIGDTITRSTALFAPAWVANREGSYAI